MTDIDTAAIRDEYILLRKLKIEADLDYSAGTILALCDALDEARAEIARLRANTTRFPELMAKIVAAKNLPLDQRIAKVVSAMGKLPDYLHRYEWESDERQLFGSKWVRCVSGNDGEGTGRQAIAECPSHI